MKPIKSLFSNAQFIFYTTVTEKFTFFILFILLARNFSVNIYGYIISLFVFLNVLSSAFELGFSSYFHREASSANPELKKELELVITLKVLLFFLFLSIAIGLYLFEPSLPISEVIILILAIYLSSFSNIFIRLLYGMKYYRKVFGFFLAGRIILILYITKGFCYGISLLEIFTAILLSNLLQFVFLLRFLKIINFHLSFPVLKKDKLKQVLISCAPMGIGVFFVWLYDRIDVLLIQNILNETFVAYYAVAYSLYKLPQSLAGVILLPMYTDLSEEFTTKKKLSFSTLKIPILLLILVSLSSIFLYLFLSDKIILLLYTANYSESVWILNLLVLAVPGLLFNNATGVILNSCRHENIPMISTVAGVGINIVINILFLGKLELAAPVIATIVTEYFIFATQLFFILKYKLIRRLNFFPIKDFS